MTAQAYTSSTTLKARIGITDSTDDTLLGTIATQTNAWLEAKIGFPVGPIASVERLFDGSQVRHRGGVAYLNCYPFGVRSISAITTADTTGGSTTSRSTSDVVIRPHDYERETDWPGFEIWVKDTALWSWTTYGYDVNGVTATWGWAAVPSELSLIADKLGIASFRGRSHGSSSTFAIGVDTDEVAAEQLTAADWRVIEKYAALKARIG